MEERAYDRDFCDYLSAGCIACLDLTETLVTEASRGERLYYWLDTHRTPRGNETAAWALAPITS